MPSETREGWGVEWSDKTGRGIIDGLPVYDDSEIVRVNDEARKLSGEFPGTMYRAVRVRITAEWED